MDRLFDQPRKLRTATAIPVKVTPQSGKRTLIACTLDVSREGARLNAVGIQLQQGDVLTIQYQTQKALFRVVWVGSADDETSGQVGVQCLENGRHFWQENRFEKSRAMLRMK
jgi:PilZ domain-containing protein